MIRPPAKIQIDLHAANLQVKLCKTGPKTTHRRPIYECNSCGKKLLLLASLAVHKAQAHGLFTILEDLHEEPQNSKATSTKKPHESLQKSSAPTDNVLFTRVGKCLFCGWCKAKLKTKAAAIDCYVSHLETPAKNAVMTLDEGPFREPEARLMFICNYCDRSFQNYVNRHRCMASHIRDNRRQLYEIRVSVAFF